MRGGCLVYWWVLWGGGGKRRRGGGGFIGYDLRDEFALTLITLLFLISVETCVA